MKNRLKHWLTGQTHRTMCMSVYLVRVGLPCKVHRHVQGTLTCTTVYLVRVGVPCTCQCTVLSQLDSVIVNVVLQLYRILFGDSSIAETRERIRRKRDTDVLPEFSDELQKHLSDMSGIGGTEASVSGYLTGASRSLLDHLLTVSHIPADGIVYQLIRDNPKLLLNPEVRQLVMRMLEAVAQSQMDSFLETYDLNEMIALLEVNCPGHCR